MKICPNCGEKHPDLFAFCSSCGSKLAPLEADEPVPGEVDAPAAEETAPPAGEAVFPPEEPIPAAQPAEETEEEPEPEIGLPEPETPPVPPPPPVKPDKPKKEKPPVHVGRRILAVLLCILLFFFLLAPALGFELRRSSTEEGLRAVLEDVRLAKLPVAPYFTDVDDAELTLSEMLSEDLGALGLKIGESSAAKILNSSALKGFLAGQAAPVLADVYRGRTRHEFEAEALKTELLAGQTARVLEKERIALTGAEADQVVALLARYGLKDGLSRDTLLDAAPGLVRAMHFGLSYVLLGALLVLALGLMLLIFKLNRWRFDLSLGDIGGTAAAVGGVLTLVTLLVQLLPGLWEKLCGDPLAAALSRELLAGNVLIDLAVLAAGVLLAVLGRMLRGKKKAKEA